jgi:putative ABC transport system substrate-binding protein
MRRTRLTLLAAFTLALLAAPRITGGQGAGKIYRIGVLDDSSPTAASTRTESFRQGMRALGRIEGQNVNIEWRFAEGKEAALSTLATELVGLKPDVLVSPSSAGIAALRNATTEIPLVMAGADPGTRYVTPENLARPGGNITGVISMGREPEGKRMECCEKRFQPYPAWRSSGIASPVRVVPERPRCRGLNGGA